MFADKDTFTEMDSELESKNILDFPGYDEKLEKSRAQSKEKESVIWGTCKLEGIDAVIASMNSEFMMGSMGTVTGDKITRAFEYATENGLPVIAFTVSGGAVNELNVASAFFIYNT